MMTSEQYRASLGYGRAVAFDGEWIPDLVKHPVLGGAVDAGGSVVTAPSSAELDYPETCPLIEKYMATGRHAGGRYRTSLMHAIRDLTADTAGGHRAVIQLHAGGGLHAQRLVTRKHYDIEAAKQRARELIGLPAEGGQA